MKTTRKTLMLAALAAIVLLIVLCIYAAFIGAEKAKMFFNSAPLAIYWAGLIILIAISFLAFNRLVTRPALLMIHLGCLLVIAGAMYGSQKSHKICEKWLKNDKICAGKMVIFEGRSENRVLTDENDEIKKLPFSVRLNDFRIVYYDPGELYVNYPDAHSLKFPAVAGSIYELGKDYGTLKIVKTFKNFKITIEGEKKIATDALGPQDNAAVEIQITTPSGQTKTQYVFEKFQGHTNNSSSLSFKYHRQIRDYVSSIDIVNKNRVTASKDIEVNHPLHYGGYHFYQHSYDDKNQSYTVLKITSDTGLYVVYTGYIMLIAALFWHFWIKHAIEKNKEQ